MRKFVAYLLIAITLLSNGMVDFAIKVCHDSDLSTGFNYKIQQENWQGTSDALKPNRSNISQYSGSENFQTNNTSEFDSPKPKKKKSCCTPKKSNNKTSEQIRLQDYTTKEESSDPFWDNLSSWIFTSDEHPCCRDNSKVQIKCCTLLNLYYFTPKFLEETTNYIPNITWKHVLSNNEIVQYQSVAQKNVFHSKYIERSDQYVPCFEDFSSSFCVWII